MKLQIHFFAFLQATILGACLQIPTSGHTQNQNNKDLNIEHHLDSMVIDALKMNKKITIQEFISSFPDGKIRQKELVQYFQPSDSYMLQVLYRDNRIAKNVKVLANGREFKTDENGIVRIKHDENNQIYINSIWKRNFSISIDNSSGIDTLKIVIDHKRYKEKLSTIEGIIRTKNNNPNNVEIEYIDINNQKNIFNVDPSGYYRVSTFNNFLDPMPKSMNIKITNVHSNKDPILANGPTITLGTGTENTRMDVYLDNIQILRKWRRSVLKEN